MVSKSWQTGGVSQTQGPATNKALLKLQVSSPQLKKAPENQGSKIAGHRNGPRGHLGWLWTSMEMWEGLAWISNPSSGWK